MQHTPQRTTLVVMQGIECDASGDRVVHSPSTDPSEVFVTGAGTQSFPRHHHGNDLDKASNDCPLQTDDPEARTVEDFVRACGDCIFGSPQLGVVQVEFDPVHESLVITPETT